MVNAAIVGLGWWGRTILKLLHGNAKLRIVKAIDVNPDSAAIAREHGVAFAGELDAALGDPAVQAVILCTPHTLHSQQIVRAVAVARRRRARGGGVQRQSCRAGGRARATI